MLTCEGYKMFSGTMRITPVTNEVSPFDVSGAWLYKPNYDCWYCNGRSYAAEVCKIVEDEDRWIPVNERFPADRKHVLIFSPSCNCIFVAYRIDGEWRDAIGFNRVDHYVTHWSKLPKSPKGE